jgi:hypothetical protein
MLLFSLYQISTFMFIYINYAPIIDTLSLSYDASCFETDGANPYRRGLVE